MAAAHTPPHTHTYAESSAEMAETPDPQRAAAAASSGPPPETTAPPAAWEGEVQAAPLSLAPPDPSGGAVTQPYPRSPKLLRKLAEKQKHSEEQLLRRLKELQVERSRTEAHLQSLKKRRANLTTSAEVMKQQVRERFEGLRGLLEQDECAVLDSVEQDRRETGTRLTRVTQDWTQHLGLLQRAIGSTQRALEHGADAEGAKDFPEDLSCPKKPGVAEEAIRLDEERFQKLLKTLRRISKDLQAQLQRKSLLLESSKVVIDRQTSHSQVVVTADGRGMCVSGEARPTPEHPLQFDRVYCALGSVAVTTGQHYWEADVRCCPSWAVGVAYGSLHRKGRDKATKLGRNRLSWSVELRDGRLSAWHNDRHVALDLRQGPPGRVGVRVNYEKGRVAFYDAGTMRLLQEFSAALTPVFDRAHHQFTEPLYPAFRFLRPAEGQAGPPDHMEVCNPQL